MTRLSSSCGPPATFTAIRQVDEMRVLQRLAVLVKVGVIGHCAPMKQYPTRPHSVYRHCHDVPIV